LSSRTYEFAADLELSGVIGIGTDLAGCLGDQGRPNIPIERQAICRGLENASAGG
jgi:hypothetical protein